MGDQTVVATSMTLVPAGKKTRLFYLMVRGIGFRPNKTDVKRFFDSFEYE